MSTEVRNVWEPIGSTWQKFRGEVKTKWDKLSDDELIQVGGNRKILASKIQEQYGITSQEAHRQIDEWAIHQLVQKLEL